VHMLFVCLFVVTLVVTTTIIHYEVLRLLNAGLPILQMPTRAKLIVVILVEFAAHTLEILLYAASYYALEYYFDTGTLGAPGQLGWLHYIYFSGETYTSLGYGDIVPHHMLRVLAGVEALNGLLLIGWSASYAYIAMERFWHDDQR
jgi:voltage-gated potassium channel Kch